MTLTMATTEQRATSPSDITKERTQQDFDAIAAFMSGERNPSQGRADTRKIGMLVAEKGLEFWTTDVEGSAQRISHRVLNESGVMIEALPEATHIQSAFIGFASQVGGPVSSYAKQLFIDGSEFDNSMLAQLPTPEQVGIELPDTI